MRTIQRAYKVELDLNHAQLTACKQHAGAARWAYNWGLQRKQEAYRATGKSPNAMELHRELNALKKTDVPWMYAVSTCAPQEALRNLDRAYERSLTACGDKRRGSARASWATRSARARSRDWAASGSPARLSCSRRPFSCPAYAACA